jgi:hypothetical protein
MDAQKPSEPTATSPEMALREREVAAREREVAAREREVSAKEKESSRGTWSNPLVLALCAAALGLIGNIWVEHANNKWAKDTEQLKSQSTLILEAIKTGDPDKACQNLLFFERLGLVKDDDEHTIQHECEKAPQGPPSLPAQANTGSHDAIAKRDFAGKVVDTLGHPIADATVNVRTGIGLTYWDEHTDANGEFVVRKMPELDLHLVISKKGFSTVEDVVINQDSLGQYVIELERSK